MTVKTYNVGDEYGDGIVTRVGTNNGSPEYTVAIQDENSERPIDIGPRVHPAAFTNGPVELAEENQKTYDAAAKEAEEASREQEKKRDESDVDGNDSPEEIREKTVTPDPAKTPAGQGAKGVTPATKSTTANK